MSLDIGKYPCGGRTGKTICCKACTFTSIDRCEAESSQSLNNLLKVTGLQSGEQGLKLPFSWSQSTRSFLHCSLCSRPKPPFAHPGRLAHSQMRVNYTAMYNVICGLLFYIQEHGPQPSLHKAAVCILGV